LLASEFDAKAAFQEEIPVGKFHLTQDFVPEDAALMAAIGEILDREIAHYDKSTTKLPPSRNVGYIFSGSFAPPPWFFSFLLPD
jgi:hypothetical protein